MFDSVDEWLRQARTATYRYESKLAEIRLQEGEANRLLAEMIEAYEWPAELPLPTTPDVYGATQIDGQTYGQDLALELACAQGCSESSARHQIGQVVALTQQFPQCWAQVRSGQAPLWQARKIVDACDGLGEIENMAVDTKISQCLGALGPARFFHELDAAIKWVDPNQARRQAAYSPRFAHTGGDKTEPLTGWVTAKIDRADSIFLEATIQLIADTLTANGDTGDLDQRRAKALGMLSNPAAIIQLVGLPTLRHLTNPPQTENAKQALIETHAKLATAFTPKTQIYIHLHADTLDQADQLARVEKIGPILIDQVKQLTQATNVRLTPVIHIGGAGETVDMYETPLRLKEQLFLRDPYDIAPWSSINSRDCDIDHTIPYQPGIPGQTRLNNLGPISRGFHRAKTLADWQLDQPQPGQYTWETGASQRFQTDKNGTHRLPKRE